MTVKEEEPTEQLGLGKWNKGGGGREGGRGDEGDECGEWMQ